MVTKEPPQQVEPVGDGTLTEHPLMQANEMTAVIHVIGTPKTTTFSLVALCASPTPWLRAGHQVAAEMQKSRLRVAKAATKVAVAKATVESEESEPEDYEVTPGIRPYAWCQH